MVKDTIERDMEIENCPIRNILDRVGDKWSVLIISMLADEPRRFNELKRMIGDITQRVLTSTLRKLEADGLISRHVEPSSPPKVTYALTDLGRDLLETLKPLIIWAKDNFDDILLSRSQFEG
ncbi:transcriptional regulatory protein [Roseibium sp. TrichSKD4]|uniref:winged helix-turn-helix transcriptional regulator n=1 Tax=Roseibium sp. TrichSKD4 TaxID=744980 RepID=UPI0001E575C4|nr:helix-turn-helix domain-containing protein [Roseibium sp. TrichSKD4]EFO29407.1 transcriptional regulatory protein [Roseibium sp. TrichSKD4]